MTEITKATITAQAGRLEQMIKKASLKASSGDAVHSEVYVNAGGGEARFLASKQNNSVISYSTFGAGFLDTVETDQEALVEDNNGTAEAIINVEDFLTYLNYATGDPSDTVELTLLGEENDRLAHALQFHGAIQTRVMLPASESNLDEVPLDAVGRFDDDTHSFLTGDGERMPALIETSVSQIQKIIDIVNDDDDTKFYPVTIQDGELYLSVGKDERRNAAWGALQADTVEGDDLSNEYNQGFEELFGTLSGDLRIETADGMPICVVQDEYEGQVLRNVIGPVNKQ
ncbi:DNA polymerase sliding clamp PCNA [Haloarcula virus HCTV-16]|nr:DNA polymerase sliding clamp PCNA [Haloarcula virus HCTV-16]